VIMLANDSQYWVGSGWVQIFSLVVGWVGLGQSADGLGWVGSGHTKWTHGQFWYIVTFVLLHFILTGYRPAKKSRVSSPRRYSSVDTQGKLGESPLGQGVIKRVAVVELGVNNGSENDGSCFGK